MKKTILVLAVLLLTTAFAFQAITIKPVHAAHMLDVTLVPQFVNVPPEEIYPEWKNFTINVLGVDEQEPDPVVKVVITYPDTDPAFQPVEYDFPDGWTATPEPALHQVLFETTGAGFTGEEDFKIKFRDGPTAEGGYTFIVSSTDDHMDAYTEYIDQWIDRTKPTVVITYPDEGDTIEGDLWINATVSDNVCIDIDSVGLYLNDSLIVRPMEYNVVTEKNDRITQIKAYWFTDSLWEENWYVAFVNATDCAGWPANDTVTFYWKPTRLVVTPEKGTACPTTMYNKDTGVYTGIPFTYGTKTLGTLVTVSGGSFTPNSKVNVYVYHPLHWASLAEQPMLVIKDAPTNNKGYFEASFRFPTAQEGIYEIIGIDTEGLEPLEPGWFTVVPEIIYKPAVMIGPAVIEVMATGLPADGWLTCFLSDGTDALMGMNSQVWNWGTDENGTLLSWSCECGEEEEPIAKPGFVMPVLEPGTYEIAIGIYGRYWDGTEGYMPYKCTLASNTIKVVNDFKDLMDAIDDLEVKLDYLKPIIERIDGNVVTIKTDVGTIKADVEDIHPMVETIDGNVVTIKTDVGTIKGTVTSIQGDTATVKTGVGDVNVKADDILDKVSEPAEVLTTYLPTVMSAIAAIAAIAAVVVVLRRLKVAA